MPTSRPVQTADKLADILTYASDVTELTEEMSAWRESIPEALSGSDKASAIEEAESTLEDKGQVLDDELDAIQKILAQLEPFNAIDGKPPVLESMISYTEHKMYKGYNAPRWVRFSNPVEAIRAAMTFIENNVGYDAATEMKLTPIEAVLHKSMKYPISKEVDEELKGHLKEVDDALSDLDNVDFPTMYG